MTVRGSRPTRRLGATCVPVGSSRPENTVEKVRAREARSSHDVCMSAERTTAPTPGVHCGRRATRCRVTQSVCAECGEASPSGVQFCPSCGHYLWDPTARSRSPPVDLNEVSPAVPADPPPANPTAPADPPPAYDGSADRVHGRVGRSADRDPAGAGTRALDAGGPGAADPVPPEPCARIRCPWTGHGGGAAEGYRAPARGGGGRRRCRARGRPQRRRRAAGQEPLVDRRGVPRRVRAAAALVVGDRAGDQAAARGPHIGADRVSTCGRTRRSSPSACACGCGCARRATSGCTRTSRSRWWCRVWAVP